MAATGQLTIGRGGLPPSGVSRSVIVLSIGGTIVLALGAFWLSFTTLKDLAILSGIPEAQAWVWPLIVDGVILEATVSVVALRNSAPAARRFAWLLLVAGAGVSVAANITHAVLATGTRVPALIAAVVASVPPLVLLAMTHLTVELTRNATPPPSSTTADPGPRTQPELQGQVVEAPEVETAAVDAPAVEASQARPAVLEPSRELSPSRASASSPGVSRAGREAARARAVELHAAGMSNRQIAVELEVHPTTVGRWVNAPDGQQDGAHHD